MEERYYESVAVDEKDKRHRVIGWFGAHATGLVAAGVSLALVGTAAAFITRTDRHTTGTFTYGDVAIDLYDGKVDAGHRAGTNTTNVDYAHIMPNEQFNYQPTIEVASTDGQGAYLYAKVTMPEGTNHRNADGTAIDTANITEFFTTNNQLDYREAADNKYVEQSTASDAGGTGWLQVGDDDESVTGKVTRTYAYVTRSGESGSYEYALQPVLDGKKAVLFDSFQYDATADEKPRDATGAALNDDTTQIEVNAFAIQVANLALDTGTAATGRPLAAAAANGTMTDPHAVWTTYGSLMTGNHNGAPSISVPQA